MKILAICQHYFPEPFRFPDILEELVKRGHDVTMVTGVPNYPMGQIYDGYENGKRQDEVINGVKVHRCKCAPRKTGVINRVINYFSFANASKRYIKKLPDDFDVVFVNQLTPVMMAEAGVKYKKLHGTKLVMYCLDLWPESLVVGGIKKNSLVYNVFKRVSKKIYTSADKILITSKLFKNYFMEKFGISSDKIEYLPQYSESQFLGLKEKQEGEDFNLVFAGNIGDAQSVETIIESARILQNENVKFHIVGDGIALERCKKQAEGLKNVVFYGRRPLEDMPKYYEMADAMIVTLIKDDVISLTLPGKVQTYMAGGKAIVGAIDGETQEVLKESQGGFCGEAENSEELAKNILLLKNSGKVKEIGAKNRQYYVENFEKEKFIDKLISQLG